MNNENERKTQNEEEIIRILKEHPELFEVALNLVIEQLRDPAAREKAPKKSLINSAFRSLPSLVSVAAFSVSSGKTSSDNKLSIGTLKYLATK